MNLDGICILLLLSTLNKNVLQINFFSNSLYTQDTNSEKIQNNTVLVFIGTKHKAFYPNKQHYFQPFMCLDLVLEHSHFCFRSLYAVFSSREEILSDESSRLLCGISDMFFIAPCSVCVRVFT